ncbi:MAG: DUF2953 domain-containing protein [Ruminococcaceae bacterium]|nr:DUF2953 domain-containing protein [Oscillospiraceae bacterium]
MPFLYTLLGIILFIIVLFLIPVRVTAHYEGTFEMYVQYLFLKIRLFPKEEKEKQPKKEKETKEKDDKKKQNKKPKEKGDNIFLTFYNNQGFEGVLQLIADTMNAVGGMFGGIFKHFVFRELYLEMKVSGSDAAETAIKYGKISSAVFPAMGYLCSKARVKKYNIDISPDFLAVKDEAMFHLKFGLSPIFVTNSVIAAGFKLFKNVLLKLIKSQNADNKDKKSFEKQVKKAIKER